MIEYKIFNLKNEDGHYVTAAEIYAASVDPNERVLLGQLLEKQINELASEGWEVADTLNNLPTIFLKKIKGRKRATT